MLQLRASSPVWLFAFALVLFSSAVRLLVFPVQSDSVDCLYVDSARFGQSPWAQGKTRRRNYCTCFVKVFQAQNLRKYPASLAHPFGIIWSSRDERLTDFVNFPFCSSPEVLKPHFFFKRSGSGNHGQIVDLSISYKFVKSRALHDQI